MGFQFRQGLFRVLALGLLACHSAFAGTPSPTPSSSPRAGATFTESDRQKYLTCASEANKSKSCSVEGGVSGSFLGRPIASKSVGPSQGNKNASRLGSPAHWNCLSRKLSSCMTKKEMSADAKGLIRGQLKLWRMFRPKLARMPEHEDVLEGAIGKEFARIKAFRDQRYFNNKDFKACLKEARTSGIAADVGKISAEEYKTGRDSWSGDGFPMMDVKDGLLACADKKKAARELASNPTATPTPDSGSGGTVTTRSSPPPSDGSGRDQPIFNPGFATSAQ
jgi:hypothetical protein